MLNEIKFRPINWVDGMKISKEHLQGVEDFLLDMVRDAVNLYLTDYNFGLIPPTFNSSESLSLRIDSERVEFYQCRAITRSGARIELLGKEGEELRTAMPQLKGDKYWYVLLKINPFNRQPYGMPDPAESPVRQPFTVPEYGLEIVPAREVNSPRFAGFALPVARISLGKGIQVDETYIPPCARIRSHRELIKIYRDYGTRLQAFEGKAMEIIMKINFRREKKSSNALAEDIFLLTQRIVDFLSGNMGEYWLMFEEQPPIQMVGFYVRFARIWQTSLKMVKGKDAILTYFKEFTNTQPSVFMDATDSLVNLRYDHLDIRQSLDQIDTFFNLCESLFIKLATLDYMQIGTPKLYDPVYQTVHEKGENKTITQQKNMEGIRKVTPRIKKEGGWPGLED